MDNILAIKSPTDLAIELATTIKKARLQKNWSRLELADRAGINIHTLRRFEETGQISLNRLLAIFLVLGMLNQLQALTTLDHPPRIKDILLTKNRKRGRRYE